MSESQTEQITDTDAEDLTEAAADDTTTDETVTEDVVADEADVDPEDEDDEESSDRHSVLENEGDIAADYLEELLDIADLDGDLDMDVEGDRASVSIVGGDVSQLVGRDGEVLEALQELTRLAVYRETGERSRLMLDIGGHRADKRTRLERLAAETVAQVAGDRREAGTEGDVALRAEGRARCGRCRRPVLGVRGSRAAPVRRGPPPMRQQRTP